MPLIERYSKKNRGMAVFLCVFLGVFGFHRFYLGKPITGLIYMFTGGFFLVGWILDIIVILFAEEMTDAKGYRLRPFPVSKSTVEYSDKSRGVALLLCAYLGVFGVHRFYLGKPKTGLLWLCTLGLGLVGWVFDMFALIFGKAKDADGLPLPPFGGVYSSFALRKKPLANIRYNNDKKAVRYVEPLFYWNCPGVV